MIARLRGKPVARGPDGLVLDVPQQPGAIPNTDTYFDLMDYIVRTLASAFGGNK